MHLQKENDMSTYKTDGLCNYFDVSQQRCILDYNAKLLLCPSWRTLDEPKCSKNETIVTDSVPEW